MKAAPLDQSRMANVSRDRSFKTIDDLSGSSAVSLKCVNSGDQSKRVSLLEEYACGALNIIIKFDEGVGRGRFTNEHFGEVTDEHITFHDHDFTGPLLDSYGGVSGSAGGSDDDSVFIRIIQSGQLVEIIPFPAREGFRSDEGIFYPLTGGFYSLAGGFETDPIIACREFEVAILLTAIDPDNLPCCMVKSGSQIMNSVAYYKGEIARQFLGRFNFENDGTGFGIALNQKSVRFFSGKGYELPFNIRHVIIGPIDFMFSPSNIVISMAAKPDPTKDLEFQKAVQALLRAPPQPHKPLGKRKPKVARPKTTKPDR